jgi:hypothetical protein
MIIYHIIWKDFAGWLDYQSAFSVKEINFDKRVINELPNTLMTSYLSCWKTLRLKTRKQNKETLENLMVISDLLVLNEN